MTQKTAGEYDFTELSLADLLAARDLYHVHLMKKRNVIATAIGYYRIRKKEHWPSRDNPNPDNSEFKSKPRTLANSEVRPYSWPAILVFVEHWETPEDMLDDPSGMVPKTFYLPDGKAVPVCVIEARRETRISSSIDPTTLNFPRNVISGGFPLMTTVQEDLKIASFGCLVTDGHYTYALTNRHVTGEEGTEISTILDGEEIVAGTSSYLQVGRLPFDEMYPDFAARQTFLNIDVGLIKVNDISQWKAEILGIGQMAEMMDINASNISLKLIGQHVVGFGAVSAKKIEGEIQALFYRYKAVGGFDYVCDFLVGPRSGSNQDSLQVHHGDSGTILLVEGKQFVDEKPVPCYQPLGILWGCHEILDGSHTTVQPYVLSTFLAGVCNYLDVDIVRNWNLDTVNTWGGIGHFKIGAYCCELVLPGSNCSTFMMNNQLNIGYSDDAMKSGDVVSGKFERGTFVPLADVPDIVWRNTRKKDESNHFADMDEHNPAVANDQDLLQLNQNHAFLTVQNWLDFDKAMDAADPVFKTDKNGNKTLRPRRGALPFRVGQCYNQMIKSLKAGNLEEFLVAGGTMSHYAGDACQPLHISFLHHGETPAESGVHSDYETKMIAKKMPELFTMVAAKGTKITNAELIGPNGKDASLRIIELMRETVTNFPPMEVLESWRNAKGRGKYDKMWGDLKVKTAATIANGAHTLAILWQSAWKHGNGDAIPVNKLAALNQTDLMNLYMNPDFVKSFTLDDTADYENASS